MSRSSSRRAPDALRPVRITTAINKHAEGSALIECGDTRVICTASVEQKIPNFLRGRGQGWVTAEYGMLPRSTGSRMTREVKRGRMSGRTQEIQRLVGRSLRAVVDLNQLGERTIWLDCDVIQADGGTRTASITGAYVALALACSRLRQSGEIASTPLLDLVAAVSVGVVDGRVQLDLCYEQDSSAEVDMNVVMTGKGDFVEIQGTAEGKAFSRRQLDQLLDVAEKGIQELMAAQRQTLSRSLGDLSWLPNT